MPKLGASADWILEGEGDMWREAGPRVEANPAANAMLEDELAAAWDAWAKAMQAPGDTDDLTQELKDDAVDQADERLILDASGWAGRPDLEDA